MFSGGGRIYCYANFFCYAIVFGPNFREGQSFQGGKLPQGGPCGKKPVRGNAKEAQECSRIDFLTRELELSEYLTIKKLVNGIEFTFFGAIFFQADDVFIQILPKHRFSH